MPRCDAHRTHRRLGAAAVEAAVVLPFVLCFLLGLWEVGRLVWVTTILTNAAREGARVAAGGTYATNPVTVAMVQQEVKDYMTAAGLPTAAVSGSTVTLTNLSSFSVQIFTPTVLGDFAQTNNCPTSLSGHQSCTFSVTFTPTATGSRTGTLYISDTDAGSPQTITLSGNGTP